MPEPRGKMMDVILTFDAIRGLPGGLAERVTALIWDAAQRDKELLEALNDATNDLIRYESEQVARMAPFMNERGCDYHQGQDDQLLQDIPW